MIENVETDQFGDAWFCLLGKLMEHGEIVSPRGQDTRELLGVKLRVADSRACVLVHPARDLNYRFMVAEWLYIMAGLDKVEELAQYNKQLAQFSDDGKTFAGAYGPRLASQWEYLIDSIKADPDCRQAVASIWTPCPPKSRDIPCTLTFQVLKRRGNLHGIVTMRSSDIWLGLPYDFFNFAMALNYLAWQVGCTPGSLTFNLGSSHLYARDVFKAQEVLKPSKDLETLQLPAFNKPPYGAGDSWTVRETFYSLWGGVDVESTTSLTKPGYPYGDYQGCLRVKTREQALNQLRRLTR